MMRDLFTDLYPHQEATLSEGAWLHHFPQFFTEKEADALLQTLSHNTPWEQSTIVIAGVLRQIPRLNAWHGDVHCDYHYSGTQLTLNPWTTELTRIKAALEAATHTRYNSVLLNLYRDGKDSVSWHADDEKALTPAAPISSLSLGATRTFQLRHRQSKQRFNLELLHGDLLVMGGNIQQTWQHQIPKQHHVTSPRINLTFRHIRKPAL